MWACEMLFGDHCIKECILKMHTYSLIRNAVRLSACKFANAKFKIKIVDNNFTTKKFKHACIHFFFFKIKSFIHNCIQRLNKIHC